MNRSNKLLAALVVAGLSALTIPSFAQTSAGPQTGSARETQPTTGSGASGSSATSDSSGSSSTSRSDRGSSGMSGSGSHSGSLSGASFEQLDANGDGRVSLTEYAEAAGHGSSQGAASRSSGSTGSAGSSSNNSDSARSRSATGAQETADQFRQLDRDRDGYLSRNELSAAQNKNRGGSER